MYEPEVQTTKQPYIIGVTGPSLGSFKTGTLALLGYIFQQSGMKIYSNFKLNYPHKNFWDIYGNIEELFRTRDAVVLADDVNNLPGFESRRPSDPINLMITHFTQQCRKRNLYFIFSAPRLIWAEIRLWDIAAMHIYADHMSVNGRDVAKWEVSDKRFSPPKSYERWLDPEPVYKLYDSYETMLPLALQERPEMTNIPMHGKSIRETVTACPRCGRSDVQYSRRDGVQYCRKCGWEREVES